MIKTAIAGGDTPMSGELIRILVNHPDVEIVWAYAPELTGRTLSSVHHGLIGESDLCFTSSALPEEVDVLFVDSANPANVFDFSALKREDLRIIDMSHSKTSPDPAEELVYGLSELFRKKIVRGATKVIVPGSIAAVSLISLFPLASHLMLDGNIEINVITPTDISTPQRIEESEYEIREVLRQVQLGYNGNVNINYKPAENSLRAIVVDIDIPCQSDLSMIRELYESTYSDHNFTFLTSEEVHHNEVEGTDKCVIHLSKNDNILHIHSVADCRMRGGAGDAVHALNLLFGLQEKTGLHLKAHIF